MKYRGGMKLLLVLAVVLLASCTLTRTTGDVDSYFLTEVKPVLQQNCLRCHNGSMPSPALNLTSKATAFKRSAAGREYIMPGDPDCSLLISSVQRGGTHPKMMPRADLSLTEDQIGMLREWIEDGANWPEGPQGTLRFIKP